MYSVIKAYKYNTHTYSEHICTPTNALTHSRSTCFYTPTHTLPLHADLHTDTHAHTPAPHIFTLRYTRTHSFTLFHAYIRVYSC